MTAPELTRDGRLPAARPNVCQSIDCHAAARVQLCCEDDTRVVWTCRRCAAYWILEGWKIADGIGQVSR